jgi:methionyl-tRNA formyltransferase
LNILYLGAPNAKISEDILKRDSLTCYKEKVLEDSGILQGKDFVISFGFRFVVPASIISRFPNKIINLHISYLPWNRGADPNLWSFLEMTPSGVSIHQMDDGIDTGPILCQRKILHDVDKDTLQSSYQRLICGMEDLFISQWDHIRKAEVSPKKQTVAGSYHTSADKNPFLPLLTEGWNTPIRKVMGSALK